MIAVAGTGALQLFATGGRAAPAVIGAGRRLVASAPATRRALTQRLSHRAARQLSHLSEETVLGLINRRQSVEFSKDFPVTRWSFYWHAGCWLSGVGTQPSKRASRQHPSPRGSGRSVRACRVIRRRGGKP